MHSKPWYNETQKKLKRQFEQLAKHVQKFPKTPHTLDQYNKIKIKFKHTIKTIKQKWEIENIRILENLSSNPKLFWQLIKKLRGRTNNSPNQVDSIPPKNGLSTFLVYLTLKKVTKTSQKVAIKSPLITNMTLFLIPRLQQRKFQKELEN